MPVEQESLTLATLRLVGFNSQNSPASMGILEVEVRKHLRKGGLLRERLLLLSNPASANGAHQPCPWIFENGRLVPREGEGGREEGGVEGRKEGGVERKNEGVEEWGEERRGGGGRKKGREGRKGEGRGDEMRRVREGVGGRGRGEGKERKRRGEREGERRGGGRGNEGVEEQGEENKGIRKRGREGGRKEGRKEGRGGRKGRRRGREEKGEKDLAPSAIRFMPDVRSDMAEVPKCISVYHPFAYLRYLAGV
ncbi:Ebna1, partial [Ophiophagus hannah]